MTSGRITLLLIAGTATLFSWLLYGVYQDSGKLEAASAPADWVLENGLVVEKSGGFYPSQLPYGSALVINGARQITQHTVDMCDQAANPRAKNTGMKVLYAGVSWSQLQALMDANVARGRKPHNGIANPLIDDARAATGGEALDIPDAMINSYPQNAYLEPVANPFASLGLYLLGDNQPVAWLSDQQPLSRNRHRRGYQFGKLGWLLWGPTDASGTHWQYALKLERRAGSPSQRCAADLGLLKITLLQASPEQEQPTAVAYHFPPIGSDESLSRQRLATGRYLAQSRDYQQEDSQLFAAAVTDDLIRAQADGQVWLAPRDAAVAAALSGTPWPQHKRDRLQALHYSAPGRYIRKQVKRWNRESRPAGLRFKVLNGGAQALVNGKESLPWQAKIGGRPVPFSGRAPLRSGGLFDSLPRNWSDWLMVKNFEGNEPAELRLTFNQPATGREQFKLLVIGQQVRLSQGRLLSSAYKCMTHQCSKAQQLARTLVVSPRQGAESITLKVLPLHPAQARRLYQADHQPVQVRKGKPVWNNQQTVQASERRGAIPVTLRDRDGTVVWENFNTLTPAITGYIDPLFGLTPGHQRSLGGMLSRLGKHGYTEVTADLTLDSALQQSVRGKLQQSVLSNPHPDRLGSVLMMDADSGEILAAASFPEAPKDVHWPDLYAFDASDFRRSPLRPRTFQHDGYSYNAPGSVFKLVVALALEKAAMQDPDLLQELKGMDMVALDKAGRNNGYEFSTRSDCYPAQNGCFHPRKLRSPSDLKHNPIVNFRKHGIFETPRNMLQKGERRYGLPEAIRDSLNTWFAWQADKSDKTLLSAKGAIGMVHARALTPAGLDDQRPVAAMVRTLGFLDNTRLDGGLLPADFNWRNGDLLKATASRLDPYESRRSVRQAAIGLRMQVTPLHIAQLAATLATGKLSRAHLLKNLNAEAATPPAPAALNIDLSRIHAGMKAVPVSGTAKIAFAKKRYADLRARLYLKTGTAPIQSNDKAKGASLNSAWLTGWLEPRETGGRRIAFACMLGYSKLTGGRACGPLMAEILQQMELPAVEADSQYAAQDRK